MKIFISVDMEGMAGITSPSQEREETVSFRRALHNQVRWIIEGIQASEKNEEVEEITIADSHGSGRNLSYDELSQMDDRISLVSGSPRPQYMVACLDETYDVAFFAGYHAGPGEICANMDHSFYGKVVSCLKINGAYMNEPVTNAAIAASYKVPVGLVIGDSGLRRQLIDKEMMPWVKFVTTKESLTRYAAKFQPQRKLREDTICAVKEVLASDLKKLPLYETAVPAVLGIDFKSTAMADAVALTPGVRRLSGTEVEITCADMKELACGISALTSLSGTAS